MPEPTVIAIVNQKGGTGKTTTTVNLGTALATLGKQVLLVDLDPQASLTYYLGFSACEQSLADLVFEALHPDDIMLNTEGVSVLPADISLADAELSLVNYPQREWVLQQLLAPIAHRFDYILIDCPPSLSILTVNALTAAQQVIIPIQLEVLSMKALDLIVNTVFSVKENLNPHLTIAGLLPVMVDYRRNVTREIFHHLQTHYGLPIFPIEVGTDVKAVEAPSFARSIVSYAPDSKSALAYKALAEKVITL